MPSTSPCHSKASRSPFDANAMTKLLRPVVARGELLEFTPNHKPISDSPRPFSAHTPPNRTQAHEIPQKTPPALAAGTAKKMEGSKGMIIIPLLFFLFSAAFHPPSTFPDNDSLSSTTPCAARHPPRPPAVHGAEEGFPGQDSGLRFVVRGEGEER
jgi:hypothetical protein